MLFQLSTFDVFVWANQSLLNFFLEINIYFCLNWIYAIDFAYSHIIQGSKLYQICKLAIVNPFWRPWIVLFSLLFFLLIFKIVLTLKQNKKTPDLTRLTGFPHVSQFIRKYTISQNVHIVWNVGNNSSIYNIYTYIGIFYSVNY